MAVTEGALTTYTAQCQQQNFCAFAEEHQPLELLLEAIDVVEYENYTASFFIRDISEWGIGLGWALLLPAQGSALGTPGLSSVNAHQAPVPGTGWRG